MCRQEASLPDWRWRIGIVDAEANMDWLVADDKHNHVCQCCANGAFLFLDLSSTVNRTQMIQLVQNTAISSGARKPGNTRVRTERS